MIVLWTDRFQEIITVIPYTSSEFWILHLDLWSVSMMSKIANIRKYPCLLCIWGGFQHKLITAGTWNILPSWKEAKVNPSCFKFPYCQCTEIPPLSPSEVLPCYKSIVHWDAGTVEEPFCFQWSLSGLLREASQMHRPFHFLGLNVLILVQNQLFKHCAGCVFSSFSHCLCHCVLHFLCIFPGSSQLCFCFVL